MVCVCVIRCYFQKRNSTQEEEKKHIKINNKEYHQKHATEQHGEKKVLTLNYILINSDLVRVVHHSQKFVILGEFFYVLRFMPTEHWFILLMV